MPPTPVTAKQSNGATVAIVIIILIIALAGAYFWITRSGSFPSSSIDNTSQSASVDMALERELNVAGNVDLEADLNNLDKEFSK